MEPPFLTTDWEEANFPTAENAFGVPSKDWDDDTITMECFTSQQWMKWVMDKPLLHRPSWVIPSRLYTFVQPQLVAYPQHQNGDGPYYRQQIISNAPNTHWNDFAEPLRNDLVHHSKTSIPLVPTGIAASIDMQYQVEVLFEPAGQYITLQLKDPIHGRVMKLDVSVTDAEIATRIAVNHRRMNHVNNDEAFNHWDARFRYWDME